MSQETINAHRLKITSLLLDREEERKKDINDKKIIKNLKTAEHEHVQYFRKEFDEKQEEIITELSTIEKGCNKLTSSELSVKFDSISKQINLLQKFVSNSTLFLKEYEVRRCQEILHGLSFHAKELENRFMPKKKFGFKNKKSVKSESPAKPVVDVDETDFKRLNANYFVSELDFCGFDSETDKTLQLDSSSICNKDVTLANLTNCTVRLFGTPSTLHMNKLINCTVLTGPIRTSIFVEKCKNCTFVLACQQFRLHSSEECNIYLHVTSRAIIEDSQKIKFAPYNLKYDTLEQDFKMSGLDLNENNWYSVDDFNWLAADKHSPNWSVMSVDDRIEDWNVFV